MKEKITRCGNCGAWQQDPKLFSQEELDSVILVYCGECETEPVKRHITRDMAIDAGDLSLEGSSY